MASLRRRFAVCNLRWKFDNPNRLDVWHVCSKPLNHHQPPKSIVFTISRRLSRKVISQLFPFRFVVLMRLNVPLNAIKRILKRIFSRNVAETEFCFKLSETIALPVLNFNERKLTRLRYETRLTPKSNIRSDGIE